jgi:hypothetical protein
LSSEETKMAWLSWLVPRQRLTRHPHLRAPGNPSGAESILDNTFDRRNKVSVAHYLKRLQHAQGNLPAHLDNCYTKV